MLDTTPTLTLSVTKLSLTINVAKSDIGTVNLGPIQVNCAVCSVAACNPSRTNRYHTCVHVPTPSRHRSQSLFNTFLPIVQGLLNTLLKNGFPLPSMDGLSLVGPQVTFQSGFMAISTNFTFAA